MAAARWKKHPDRSEGKRNRFGRGASPPAPPVAPPDVPISFVKAAFSGRALWVSLALIAANVAVYASVWRFEFVNYDDPVYVTDNARVLRGLTWRNALWAFLGSGHAANWHPLTSLSHLLDVEIWGVNAGGHHVTSVLFHTAASVLLFGVLHAMTGALGPSAFVAALFAVHPLHVESVAWVSERKDVLSTFFWMLTLWAYLAYVRQPSRKRKRAVSLWFALGLMSKPMLVTLPFALLLLDIWPLDRLRLAGGHGSLWALLRAQKSVAFQLVREKLPLFALSAASSIITLLVQRRWGAVAPLDAFPFGKRLGNALLSYVSYIGKMLWPENLGAFYPYPSSLPAWQVVGASLLLVGVSVVVLWQVRRRPYLLVGWLWYLGTLVPVVGFVQVGEQAMADRYTYVPLIGLCIIAAWGGAALLARWGRWTLLRPAAAIVVIAACAFVARAQVQHWRNTITLWTHALEATPLNHRPHLNLGAALSAQGKMDEARGHYLEALRINPNVPEAHTNLGAILEKEGRVDEAIDHYAKAARLKPGLAELQNNLGALLHKQGKLDEALARYTEALRLRPRLPEAHYNVGSILDDQGKVEEAVGHYHQALEINPGYAEAHNNLGAALFRLGKIDEALHEFLEAARLKPDYAEAHLNAGIILQQKGDAAAALSHFETALKLNPNNPQAQLALDSLRRSQPSAPRAP